MGCVSALNARTTWVKWSSSCSVGHVAEVRSLREVPPEQAVGVLVASSLPRAVRIAEEDLDARIDGEAAVLGHLPALIPGERSAEGRRQFGDALLRRHPRRLRPRSRARHVPGLAPAHRPRAQIAPGLRRLPLNEASHVLTAPPPHPTHRDVRAARHHVHRWPRTVRWNADASPLDPAAEDFPGGRSVP